MANRPSENKRRWATLDEAGEYLGCQPRTIRRMIASGELRGYRFGPRMLRVRLDDIEALARPIPNARTTA